MTKQHTIERPTEVGGTVLVDGKEIDFTEGPVPKWLVGQKRWGEVCECPFCKGQTLRWNPIDHNPSLAWACAMCGYTEHPPIKAMAIDATWPNRVQPSWKIRMFPVGWVSHESNWSV